MNNICSLIDELIEYGKNNRLIDTADTVYSRNKLLEFFKVDEYVNDEPIQESRALHLILEDMMTYASENNLLESDTITFKDLFDTAIMGLITPPPSVVRNKFYSIYQGETQDTTSVQVTADKKNSAANQKTAAEQATDFYYAFSKATNYIRTDRIAKDEKWVTSTEFGDIDITINLSKPEKDPRDIAAAGKAKKSGYPSCLLCMENEGYAGHFSHPARQNHRIIPITLDNEPYYLQYSPYVYYNEHCIIFNEKHTPMKINASTMKKLLSFVEMFPHYTAGSNADLPIVGGSILSHDHFQGGGYEFAMVRAPYENEFTIPYFEDIHAGTIKWPMSTIRLQGTNIDRIVKLADHILNCWRGYTDKNSFIFAETDGEPHNTITPIARMRRLTTDTEIKYFYPDTKAEENANNGDIYVYELDLVLRNNITTDEHPLGVFHPHAEYHHIKKENIGLIEVMGLAVLPARLKNEIAVLEDAILSGKDLYADESIKSHASWAADFLPKYGFVVEKDDIGNHAKVTGQKNDTPIDQSGLHKIIQDEIGFVFSGVLEDAGVFKRTKEGQEGFLRFIESL